MLGSAYGSLQITNRLCNPTNFLSPLDEDKTKMLEHFITKVAPKAPIFDYDLDRSSSDLYWRNEYSEFLNSTFDDEHFEPLLSQKINEDDLKAINCPQFNNLSKDEKKKFYIIYLAAISEASSDYNPKDESYSRSDKTTNYGLLQIDPKSAEQHASSVLEKPIDKNHLITYQTNLKAGAYILKHQVAGKIATGRLFPENIYYWPVLKNARKRVLNTFQKNSSNLPFCTQAKIETKMAYDEAILPNKEPEFSLAPLYKPDDSNEIQFAPRSLGDYKLIRAGYPDPLLQNSRARRPGSWRKTNSSDSGNMVVPPRAELAEDDPIENSGTVKPALPNPKQPVLNEEAFAQHLLALGNDSHNKCAQGVRESLNVLFGKNTDYGLDSHNNGKPAKDFNEAHLGKWRKGNSCFKEAYHDNKDSYQNYDVRVLLPKNEIKENKQPFEIYGHIELYYNGNWYSDFNQGGSIWDNEVAYAKGDPSKNHYGSSKLYRLSNCGNK